MRAHCKSALAEEQPFLIELKWNKKWKWKRRSSPVSQYVWLNGVTNRYHYKPLVSLGMRVKTDRILIKFTVIVIITGPTNNYHNIKQAGFFFKQIRKLRNAHNLQLQSKLFFLYSYIIYKQHKIYRTTLQRAWKYIATLWRLWITSELKTTNIEVSLSA